jgi:hypothetical protein
VTVFAGSGPIGGLFAGGVAQVLGPPAGFILGAAFASIFLALAAWKLGRGRPAAATDPRPEGRPEPSSQPRPA